MNLIAAIAVTLIVAGAAGAKPDRDPNNLLAGPEVASSNVTGLASVYVDSESGDRMAMASRLGVVAIRQVIEELRTAEDAELRLAAEQIQQIEALTEDLQTRTRAFEREHGRELRRLRQAREPQVRRMDQQSPQPQAIAPMTDDQAMTDTDARLRELEAMRPSPLELEKPIRAQLTERQVRFLDERIDQMAAERYEQRQMESLRRQAADSFAKQRPQSTDLNRLPERLRKRIEALPEEERAGALERVRNMYAQRRANEAAPARAIDPHPAPGMDRVKVPDPGSR